MKLSKFVKRAKSESYCMVIHADDSGIWLGTRLALYNATELPEMEGKEQVGAVLDIDSKAWEKMFFDEKYAETAGADFGVNLTDADPLEQEARRVPLEMFYKGMGLVGLMYGNAGELIFYDSALIAPIADVVKNSDYIQTVVRKTAGESWQRRDEPMKSQEKRLCPLCERHQRMETTSGMLFWVEWGEDGNPRLCTDTLHDGGGLNVLCIDFCPLCGREVEKQEALG